MAAGLRALEILRFVFLGVWGMGFRVGAHWLSDLALDFTELSQAVHRRKDFGLVSRNSV